MKARRIRLAVACFIIAVASAVVMAGDEPRRYAGRPVADVLRELQTAGLQLLFSSDLVPVTLRVKTEPTAREPRQIAVQILTPHNLILQTGPRGTLLVVKRPKPAAPTPAPVSEPRQRRKADTASGRSAANSPGDPETVRTEEWVDVTDRPNGGRGEA